MMSTILKIIVGGLLFFFSFMAASAKSQPTKIYYEVLPVITGNAPKIKIGLSLKGDVSGSTKIRLPFEFGGQTQLYKAIKNLRLISLNAELIDTAQPEIKIIKHRSGAKIKLEYELIQDWIGEPQGGGASGNAGGGYRPILQPGYFHFLGSGAWILPNLPNDAELKVSIKWKNIPPNSALANSFGTNKTSQSFTTKLDSFISAVFLGGDYKVLQATVKNKPVFVAVRGKWSFTNEEFTSLATKVIGAEREFWSDFDHPYYLVTLTPLNSDPNSKSIGGTGLTNSFATFVTTNVGLNEIAWLLAHEYFHNWNPTAFGGMKQPEQLVYWFTEGFTDYYAHYLLLSANLIDLRQFVGQYNEFLADYYRSPARNESNKRVLRDFFTDNAVYKLPYRRGMLLAAKWNEIIRQQTSGTKSLDDVMRQILRDAKTGKIKEVSTDYVVSVLSQYAAYDFAGDVEKYVENGDTISNFKGVFGECVDSVTVNSGQFELGFDFETASKSKVAAQVVKTSAAYAAGVRDGQKILGVSVYFGMIDRPVNLTIEENGQSRKITYFPETIEKVSIPQFKVRENLSENEIHHCFRMPFNCRKIDPF